MIEFRTCNDLNLILVYKVIMIDFVDAQNNGTDKFTCRLFGIWSQFVVFIFFSFRNFSFVNI